MKKIIAALLLLTACSKSMPDTVVVVTPPPIPDPPTKSTMFAALKQSAEPSSIVCVGSDFTAEGYPVYLQSDLNAGGVTNATVWNFGQYRADSYYLGSLIEEQINPHYISPGSNIAVVWEILIDIRENRTQDAVPLRHFRDYCDSLRVGGWKVIVVTVPYVNTWYVYGDYTPSGYDSTGFNGQLSRINDSLRLNLPTYGDALADVAADDRFNHYDSTYYNPDHMSLTAKGSEAVAGIILQTLQTTNQ